MSAIIGLTAYQYIPTILRSIPAEVVHSLLVVTHIYPCTCTAYNIIVFYIRSYTNKYNIPAVVLTTMYLSVIVVSLCISLMYNIYVIPSETNRLNRRIISLMTL